MLTSCIPSPGPLRRHGERTKLYSAGDQAGIDALEKKLLAQNAQHKDWACTEEMMKLTRDGKALNMHCLPADITGLSCKEGEVDNSVFDRYIVPLYKAGLLQALHHCRHDLHVPGEGSRESPDGSGCCRQPSQAALIDLNHPIAGVLPKAPAIALAVRAAKSPAPVGADDPVRAKTVGTDDPI